MERLAVLLRLDQARWKELDRATNEAAIALVIGTFVVLAWNRFGTQGVFSPRASVRMLLVGIYGWLGLAVGLSLMARLFGDRSQPRIVALLRLTGFAHGPLLAVAVVMLVMAGFLQVLGPALVLAVITFSFAMPANLIAATRTHFDVAFPRAMGIVVAPYLVWVLLVGTYLERSVGHLL